jgi:hypothetical protein
MDVGFQIALSFFGVGILWLLASGWLIGIVEWVRKLLG